MLSFWTRTWSQVKEENDMSWIVLWADRCRSLLTNNSHTAIKGDVAFKIRTFVLWRLVTWLLGSGNDGVKLLTIFQLYVTLWVKRLNAILYKNLSSISSYPDFFQVSCCGTITARNLALVRCSYASIAFSRGNISFWLWISKDLANWIASSQAFASPAGHPLIAARLTVRSSKRSH